MKSRPKKISCPSRILICSLGSIGRRYVRVLRDNFPGVEIAAIRSGYGSDSDEQKLLTCLFKDFDSAVDWNPGAAIIASPAPFHLDQALTLARAKIPLLIEKPIGVGNEPISGWHELLNLSNQIPILVGYIFRHDPCAKYIKQVLASETLGKLLDADFYCGSWLPDWRSSGDYRNQVSSCRSLGGGVLLELSHEIDLAHYLLGKYQLNFSLLQNSGLLEINVEDQALLGGKSIDNVIVSIRLNFCSRPTRRYVNLRGKNAELTWDLVQGLVRINKCNEPSVCFKSKTFTSDHYTLQLRHFFDCIYGKSIPCCSISDSLEVLRIVSQARSLNKSQYERSRS